MRKILSTLLLSLVLPCMQLSISNYQFPSSICTATGIGQSPMATVLKQCSICTSAKGVGTWKAYMAYHDITAIEKGGDILYILASDNLYSYNTHDQSIQTYDKVDILSDCGISNIIWNDKVKKLIIIYNNYNIDLLDQKDNIENISDYYNKSMTEDKTIYHMYNYQNFVFMSTGFGIVKVNVDKVEISETYQLGFKVDYCYVENGYIYAASSTNGLYRAYMNDNLLDKSNWNRVGEYQAINKTIDPELLALANKLNPGGPEYNLFTFMKYHNGKLYTAGGGFSASEDSQKPGIVQVLKDNEWQIYENNFNEKLDNGHHYLCAVTLDVDPKNDNHVFVGAKSGLFEFINGKFIASYNPNNSPLVNATTIDYTLTMGVKYDDEGNLWCTNCYTPNSSLFKMSGYYPDYQWESHHKEALMSDGRSLFMMEDIIIDSKKRIWFVNNHWGLPALICYNPSTDSFKVYSRFTNEDGATLTVRFVRCVAEDLSGNIWIGTDVGPLYLDNENINTEPTEAVFMQVKVPRNDGTNFADYLLSGVNISCMTIDGAGRKWFGTDNLGVYLISEDNITQVKHFTAANSKLLSDNVLSVAMNDKTGEVFFGTDKGLCSYMSDATATNDEMTKDNVYAYPNPVRPDYTGLITITGLSYNADIKIVTSNGILVAKGKSTGGSFTWDGNDLNGKRVASGIYMVQTATQTGDSGTVCKIAVIN